MLAIFVGSNRPALRARRGVVFGLYHARLRSIPIPDGLSNTL